VATLGGIEQPYVYPVLKAKGLAGAIESERMQLPDRLTAIFQGGESNTQDHSDVKSGRRRFMQTIVAGGLGLGALKSADNVVLGYGPIVGENLHTQPLAELTSQGMFRGHRSVKADNHRLVLMGDILRVYSGDTLRTQFRVDAMTPVGAAALDTELGLRTGPLEQVVRDLQALTDGVAPFAFGHVTEVFERARAANPRPYTTGLLRGGSIGADQTLVAEFLNADTTDPEAVIRGLVPAFREKTDYDVPRYLAGAVQFNIAMNRASLREPFEEPVDWAALTDKTTTGMFCNEYAKRSVEALHAVDPRRQTPPTAGALVYDTRHRHVYTLAASVVREDGELVIPTTFLDYMHATLYDDAGLTGVMGEGLEAYNRRHRATNIGWRH